GRSRRAPDRAGRLAHGRLGRPPHDRRGDQGRSHARLRAPHYHPCRDAHRPPSDREGALMSTKKKNTTARDDSAGGSLLLAVLASPLGWLADDRPVALRDRAPHGDDSDSLAAQVSAALWSLALLVVAVLAPAWWAAPAVVAVLVLVLPARTAVRLGGVMLVPTDQDRGAPGRLAVAAWALGLGRPVSYALVDRREADPEGLRGRRRRRLRVLLGIVTPTGLLALDAALHGALSAALAPLWSLRVIITDGL